jgi:lipopolysaccharide/colanic/teichoic acid biosynthesis glycosyltransferase
MIDLDRKLNETGVPDFNKNARTSELKQGSNKNSQEYKSSSENCQSTLQELKSICAKNQPILVTCSAIAMVAGLIQLSASFFVIFSESKVSVVILEIM